MKILALTLSLSALCYAENASSDSAPSNCVKTYGQVAKEIAEVKKSDVKILEQVRLSALKSPECLCEVVKASIVASSANKELVKSIVETAIIAAPDQLEAIVNCSIAIAPDAANEIAEVAKQFSDNASVGKKDSSILFLSGKNGYYGGKNGGKNGAGHGQGEGNNNAAPNNSGAQNLSGNPLDNLGSGTDFTQTSVDPGVSPASIQTGFTDPTIPGLPIFTPVIIPEISQIIPEIIPEITPSQP